MLTIPISGSETPQQMLDIQGQLLTAIAQNNQFTIQQMNQSGAAANNANQLMSFLQSNPSAYNFSDVQSSLGNANNAGGVWSGGSGANVAGANLAGNTAAGQNIANLGAQNAASLGNWFYKNLGNASFIVIGVLLGLGALLISQRETVIKVATTAAKTAAVTAA